MSVTVRQLKEKASEQVEALKHQLITAEDMNRVVRLQAEARAFSELIAWIDAPEPEKTRMSDAPGY